MTSGAWRVGRGERDVAKAALVDFLRNDKWGVASGTWRVGRGKWDVSGFLRNCKSDFKPLPLY